MRKTNSIFAFIKERPFKVLATLLILIAILGTGVYSYETRSSKFTIVYSENLDKIGVKVDGQSLSLRQLAFYVAYEEGVVQEQAIVYNPDDTFKYWNVHVDNEFIRFQARDSAMEEAIHDEIFYQMALAEELALNEDEKVYLENTKMDFCSDLEDRDGIERLGVTVQDIEDAMDKIALAQKMQLIYAESNGLSYEDLDFNDLDYENIRDSHQIEIDENLWKKVDFGRVTLVHTKKTKTGSDTSDEKTKEK